MSPSAKVFCDRYAPKYAAKPIVDELSYNAKLERVRSLLKPSDRILEVGCGTGGTTLQLAPSCPHITASDISGRMIAYARTKKQGTDIKNIRFVHANATRALEGAPFDKIMAFSLLHLVPDISAVLRSAHNQLKPGGLFVSKTVCLGERNLGIRTMIHVMKALRIAPDVKLLSQSSLKDRIHQAGFKIIEYNYFGNQCMDPFIVAQRHG